MCFVYPMFVQKPVPGGGYARVEMSLFSSHSVSDRLPVSLNVCVFVCETAYVH